jgi:hypothetical protein
MVPSNPSDRLDMTEREIYGVAAAVKLLLPAIKELYGSLNDEQKAHLVLNFGRSTCPSSSGKSSNCSNCANSFDCNYNDKMALARSTLP